MFPTVVFALGPIMSPVVVEITRDAVVLFVKCVTVVWLYVPDDQFAAYPVVEVNVLRQPFHRHPGPAITVVVTAGMEMEVNTCMRVVVVIVKMVCGIIVTDDMVTGRGADDDQRGANDKLKMTAHDAILPACSQATVWRGHAIGRIPVRFLALDWESRSERLNPR